MPYTVAGLRTEYVRELWNSGWFRVQDVKAVSRMLGRCNYSVISERNKAHDALCAMIDDGKTAPFSNDVRFPDGWTDLFLSDHEVEVTTTFVGLQAVLSYRPSNVAKDTAAVTDSKGPGGKGDKDVVLAVDQGYQDNVRRFEALRLDLEKMLNNKDLLWTQGSFEMKAGCAWA